MTEEEQYLHERAETAEVRSEFLQRIFILNVINSAAIVLGLVGGAIFYGSIHGVTTSTNQNTKVLKIVVERIDSCTKPQGKCNKRGQRQQGSAVKVITKYTLYANQCADRLEGDKAIDACVINKIRENFSGPVIK